MSIVMQHADILLILACVFGFFMAWGVGANDVANAMGTSVGSKAITIRQAIVIAMIFEFAGAWLAGGEVTSTIRKGIVDPSIFTGHPELLVYGMLAALLAAGTWLMIATHYGWPVSTTHSIVGAIVGFASVGISPDAVQWGKVGTIALSWVTSPLLSGIIGFLLFVSVQKLIFDAKDPFANAKRYVPVYIFLVGFLVAMVTMIKGLKHIGLDLSTQLSTAIAALIGIAMAILGAWLERRIHRGQSGGKMQIASVERIFALLMMFTACAMAFAHGSNDVANAVGPLAAVVSVVSNAGTVGASANMPVWVLLLGGMGIVAGLAMYGHKVIATVGNNITELTPSRGFAATLATAATVVIASGTGLPISTTHTLVGAVLGVGLARGIAALNLRVIGSIFASWLVTLPAGATLAIIFFFILKLTFGTEFEY
ncbi:phosphate permease [Terasakiispira papahanaumokuakeensis]|uniref:Phosphate transporter n=1 Tax=Terasakiispira papahanaumokuakeensis TaxID=197479 RepID=A0A1E2V5V8_9GAMM|nr:inorganic phosphate transporter [Terasakiispira papahanaumokuakeensis]ODC02359.1 phosphate permease [Terasakiispira papahanaumokuakeensis]